MSDIDTNLIATLKKDIKEITDDISDLMWDRKMYTEFVDIVTNNSKINTTNAFYDFIKTGYVSHIILGICRQIDKDERSLSLFNLLNKIFNNSEKITKKWYADQYKNTALNEKFGEIHFKEHFGNLDFIDPTIIYADLGNLVFYTKEIKKYRDKRIAHVDKGVVTFDKDFSFTTLNKAIDVIEELGKKYYLLLHQGGFDTLLPTDTTSDYRKIFYEPWMTKIN
ncbi:MAG: hypothetical protein WCV88_01025 [Patescibacteria group bacterium]|jgi:hypothetical protein